MICIVRLYCGEQWQRQGAGLGIRREQGRWGTGARAGALGRAAGAGACGRALGARAWHGQARCRRADARASGARRRAAGAWGARGLGPGLALGSALGALGPFSIRFDSFFFPESPNEHCSL